MLLRHTHTLLQQSTPTTNPTGTPMLVLPRQGARGQPTFRVWAQPSPSVPSDGEDADQGDCPCPEDDAIDDVVLVGPIPDETAVVIETSVDKRHWRAVSKPLVFTDAPLLSDPLVLAPFIRARVEGEAAPLEVLLLSDEAFKLERT